MTPWNQDATDQDYLAAVRGAKSPRPQGAGETVMNLKTLYNEVVSILDDEPICLSVDIWNHRRQDGVEISVSIWDGTKHYVGPTPEVAVALLRQAYGKTSVSEIPEVVLP